MADQPEYSYTLGSYLNNPVGVGAASGTMRKAVLDSIRAGYEKVRKGIKRRFFTVGSSFLVAISVPSSSVEDFWYDVVIEFLDAKENDELSTKNIRVFSNAPSFVFTYAFVFEERALLIPFLKKLIPKEVFKEAPKTRNPDETINYEKTIVSAMFYILDNDIMRPPNHRGDSAKLGKINAFEQFRSFESSLAIYNSRKRAIAIKKKAEKEKIRQVKLADANKKKVERATAAKKTKKPIRKR